jgi:hypothetical protein
VPCTISTLCVHSISAIRQQSQVATVPQKYTTRRAGSPRTTATSLQKPAWPRRVDGSESELLLGDQKCSSCRAPFDSLHRPRYRAVYTRPDPPRARRHRIDRPLIKTRCVRAGRACRRVGTLVIVKCLLYIRICFVFVLFCFCLCSCCVYPFATGHSRTPCHTTLVRRSWQQRSWSLQRKRPR